MPILLAIQDNKPNHFQAKNNVNFTIKEQGLYEETKKLYEEIIQQLKAENAYLKQILNSFMNK